MNHQFLEAIRTYFDLSIRSYASSHKSSLDECISALWILGNNTEMVIIGILKKSPKTFFLS